MSAPPKDIIEFRSVSKAFCGIPVLKDICFAVRDGVTGLVGENGAGKSTLMNILGGVLPLDTGQMLLAGRPYAPRDSREAARCGVAFIHQELNLFLNLTIAENLHLPDFPRRPMGRFRLPIIDRAAMRQNARRLLEAVGLNLAPDHPVDSLSAGQRQLVEIARAMGDDSRLIIFDEPTTSLTSREAERLFSLIASLKAKGTAILYISHQLDDVLRLSDRVVVLRDGRIAGEGDTGQMTSRQLISLMVGRDIAQLYPPRADQTPGKPMLEAKGITRAPAVRDAGFTLRAGEVLGIAGLMGAGRTELARLLFGLDRMDAGEVLLKGLPLFPQPFESIRRGLVFLTEDRRSEGLMIEANLRDNISLASLRSFSRTPFGILDERKLQTQSADAAVSINIGGVVRSTQNVNTLSGGNQQKVVLAKWLLTRPDVLILDEPTRGIDVGAKHEIYRLINALVERGAAILLISSELGELEGMCDRILVMALGRLVAEFSGPAFDRKGILAAAFVSEDAS